MPDPKEKDPLTQQSQTGRKKIQSRVIITRRDNNENWATGFIGSVADFRAYLKAQRRFLETGVIAP